MWAEDGQVRVRDGVASDDVVEGSELRLGRLLVLVGLVPFPLDVAGVALFDELMRELDTPRLTIGR